MSQMNQHGELNVPQPANSWEWETCPYTSGTGRKYRDVLRRNTRTGQYNKVARCIEASFNEELYIAIQRADPIPRPRIRDNAGLWLQTKLEHNGQFVLEINRGLVAEETQTITQQTNSWEWETCPYTSGTGRKYRDVLRRNTRMGHYTKVARCIEEKFSEELYEAIQRANPVPRPNVRDQVGWWVRCEYDGRFVLEINCPVTEDIQTVLKNSFGHKYEPIDAKFPLRTSASEWRTNKPVSVRETVPAEMDRSETHCLQCGHYRNACVCRRESLRATYVVDEYGNVIRKRNFDWHH